MGHKRKQLTHVHRRKSAKRPKTSENSSTQKPKNKPADRFHVEEPTIQSSSSPLTSEDEEMDDPFVQLVMDLRKSTKKALSDAETEEDSNEDSEAEDEGVGSGNGLGGISEEEVAGSEEVEEEEADSGEEVEVGDEEEEVGSEEVEVEDEEEEVGSEEEEVELEDEEENDGSEEGDDEDDSVVEEEEEDEEDGSGEEDEDDGSVADDEEEEIEASSDVAEEEGQEDSSEEEGEASGGGEEGEAGSVVAEEEEEEEEADSGVTNEAEVEAGEGEDSSNVGDEAETGVNETSSGDDVDGESDVLAESESNDDSYASEDDLDKDLTNNLRNPSTDDVTPSGKDPFVVHFENLIPESSIKKLEAGDAWQKKSLQTDVGKSLHFWIDDDLKCGIPKTSNISFDDLHIKQRIHVEKLHDLITNDKEGVYSKSQVELFFRIYSYQDIYYSEKNYKNQEPIEMAYCLHVLNHTLKSRLKVTSNNSKQKVAELRGTTEEFPDQGITRPKVLIIVPFRETARRIVSNFIKILASDKSQTDNKKRFFSEYSSGETSKFTNKPEDYSATFAGNIDDHFKIGLGISHKKLQIYTKFYSSDIIISSPLGLRSVIGETQSKKEYDFLSSIEILILDQTDIFLMQNWEHLMYIMDHLHLQPKDPHGCDFSRVRAWALNSWNKYYRQTLILSSLSSPQINLLFNKYCFNYSGKLMIYPRDTDGSICQVALQIPMIFHRIESSSYSQSVDTRFNTFIKKILPKYQHNPTMSSTLIFIPSYFDFVRIRNYFIKHEIDFLQISEYSKRKDIAATRSRFFLGKTNFLLYTERHHFYFRTRLRGIRHIIFYELPLYPHFFSEVCNLINDVKLKKLPQDDTTGTILYSKYDVQRLASVVGTKRSSLMIHSSKLVHMFVTES